VEKYFFPIFINLLISAVIYFGIAAVFILIGKRKKTTLDESGLTFNELFLDYTNVPRLKTFAAREGMGGQITRPA